MKLLTELRTVVLRFRLLFLKSNQELVIITGSSSSHFKSLFQLLKSLMIYEAKATIIVYDLGLRIEQYKAIESDFPTIELRKFNYNNCPDYFNINIDNGKYAWKPVIINEVLNEFKCSICWLDGGNVLKKELNELRKIIKLYGFYSPFSKGTIKDWTHHKTLKYFKVSNDSDLLRKTNLNGANVAADYHNKSATLIINEWAKCALTKECIAPEGATRENHRYDQAILSVLVHINFPSLGKRMLFKKFGFKTHQDID